jgi:hypothetical protein
MNRYRKEWWRVCEINVPINDQAIRFEEREFPRQDLIKAQTIVLLKSAHPVVFELHDLFFIRRYRCRVP